MNVETILATKGREVRTIKPEASIGEALRRLHNERVGALVVSPDGSSIAGIVSEHNLACAIAERGTRALEEPISAVMTEKVFTCSARDRVASLMATMTRRRFRHIPVVDGAGRLCGIVSIGDVVKHHLNEIQSEAEALREYIAGSR